MFSVVYIKNFCSNIRSMVVVQRLVTIRPTKHSVDNVYK